MPPLTHHRLPTHSELFVFDAASIGDGPRVRLPLPEEAQVPYGLHSVYVPWKDLV